MNILVFAVPVLVVLALLVLVASLRRRDTSDATGQLSRLTRSRDGGPLREGQGALRGKAYERTAVLERKPVGEVAAAGGTPVPWTPPDAEEIGVSRRQFLNRSIVGAFAFSLSGFATSIVAFLWPVASGGFGSKIVVGNINDILAEIRANDGFMYRPEGRLWITEYPEASLEKAKAVYSPNEIAGMESGIMALYHKCPHLGCRVPQCLPSQWFECPCHGSQFSRVGEWRRGPTPRGLDHFAISIDNGVLTVDTGTIIQGQPIGLDTTGQAPEGPHCVGASGGE